MKENPPQELPVSCQSCGSQQPTVFVSLSQTTGAVLVRYEAHIYARLCARCLKFHFWRFTRHNLLLGWWGPFSAFLTVVWTFENVVAYARAKAALKREGLRRGHPAVTQKAASSGLATFEESGGRLKKCPKCARNVLKEATRCLFCRYVF